MKATSASLPSECEIVIDDAVLERHPGTRFAFLAVPAAPYADPAEATRAEASVLSELRGAFAGEDELRASPEDALYRQFYRGMGLKAAQVSTPVKQALRVLRNGSYSSRGPVVDTAMAIEYSTLVSFQVYAATRLTGPLTFSLAGGEEPIETVRGERKSCKPGELLLLSGDAVVHSCYYGNDPAFFLGEEDEIAVVRVMGVPGLAAGLFERAFEEAARRLSPIDTAVLERTAPSGRLSLGQSREGSGR